MSLHAVRQALLTKRISIEQLHATFLERTLQNSHLNAFTSVHSAQVCNPSTSISSPTEDKPLSGFPIGVKDNFCTTVLPTTCASKMLSNFTATYNATVAQRLFDRGAFLWGKCNMDEFAMGCSSTDTSIEGAEGGSRPVRNPWNTAHISGGSSGGSACAVAAGLVLAALGSDTGGSTRNPASHCGVVGLKPTYGALSRHGLIPLVNSLDVPGVLANSVEDCEEVFRYINGWDEMDSTTVPNHLRSTFSSSRSGGKFRIGLPKEFVIEGMDPDILRAWDHAAGLLDNAGFTIRHVSLPNTQHAIKCYSVLCCAEVASNMARYDGVRFGHRATHVDSSTEQLYAETRSEAFNDVVRRRILTGNYFLLRRNYQKYYLQALKVWRLITQDFKNVFENNDECVDLLLTPVTPTVAPSMEELMQQDYKTKTMSGDVFTQSVNLAGLPGIVVPVALSSQQLPIGLQLIGRWFQEDSLFHVSKLLQDAVAFPRLFNIASVLK